MLHAMCDVYISEWRSLPHTFDESPKTHFYIRDWGITCDIDNLNVQWHIPSKEEIDFVNELHNEFLIPQFDILDKIKENQLTLSR